MAFRAAPLERSLAKPNDGVTRELTPWVTVPSAREPSSRQWSRRGPKWRIVGIERTQARDQVIFRLQCGHALVLSGWRNALSIGPLDVTERQCPLCEQVPYLAERPLAAALDKTI